MNQTDIHLSHIQKFVGGTVSFNFLDVPHHAKINSITEIVSGAFAIYLGEITMPTKEDQIFYGENLVINSANCGVTSNPRELVFSHVFRPTVGFGDIVSLRLPD